MENEPYCCRCGTEEADVYWGPAAAVDAVYWLCTECQDAILYLWIMEHYSLIGQFRKQRTTAP